MIKHCLSKKKKIDFFFNSTVAILLKHIIYTYCIFYIYIYVYRVSVKWDRNQGSMEEVKENKKILYHFAVFAIGNELLIIKNRRISPAY